MIEVDLHKFDYSWIFGLNSDKLGKKYSHK